MEYFLLGLAVGMAWTTVIAVLYFRLRQSLATLAREIRHQ